MKPGDRGRIMLCGDPSPLEKLPWLVEKMRLLSGDGCKLFCCCGGGVRKPCSEDETKRFVCIALEQYFYCLKLNFLFIKSAGCLVKAGTQNVLTQIISCCCQCYIQDWDFCMNHINTLIVESRLFLSSTVSFPKIQEAIALRQQSHAHVHCIAIFIHTLWQLEYVTGLRTVIGYHYQHL